MTSWRASALGARILGALISSAWVSVRARLRFAAGLLPALGLLLLGCPRAEEGEASPKTPVIVISLDTLRADAVADSRTPHLARFRTEAVSFHEAYSEIPFTLPAHATMLTGLAPDTHGLFDAEDRFPPQRRTLAEILSAAGYGTAAVVSSDWLRPGFGFGRGFVSYREVPLGLTFAEEVTRLGLASLDEILQEAKAPFLFLHYYDAHSDFELKGNRRAYFASADASEGLEPGCAEPQCSADGECATNFLLWANRHAEEVTPEQRRCLAASYRAGVRDLDAAFGRLVGQLEQRGLYDKALIVVTSDHGEEFGEHGQFIHAQPFVESLAIPLWIKLPGQRDSGRVVQRPAQLADLAPTVLGQLGLPGADNMTGRDLFARSTDGPRLILGQNKYRPQRYSAQRGHWKLIHDFVEDRSSLYDREEDPGELIDIARLHPRIVGDLLSRLEALRAELLRRESQVGPEAAGSEVLTPEARRRLEALGYVD